MVEKNSIANFSFLPKVSDLVLSKKVKGTLKQAVSFYPKRDISVFCFKPKEAKKLLKMFNIWKRIYHENHIGIHFYAKDTDENFLFFKDVKCDTLFDNFSQLAYPKPVTNSNFIGFYNENQVKKLAKTIFSFFSYIHKNGFFFFIFFVFFFQFFFILKLKY